MDPVVHFEMPAKDRERMKDFYKSTFGWEMMQMGPEMGNYVMAVTAESDEKGPKKPGSINGGFYDTMPDAPHPSIVIQVGDINASMSKVKGAGGEILGEPMDIPGVGQYVAFNDSEGNRVGMLQPSM